MNFRRRAARRTLINHAMRWIGTIAREDDVVCVTQDAHNAYYQFRFPLNPRNPKWHSAVAQGVETFRLSFDALLPTEGFVTLFASPLISVEEKIDRSNGARPLRFPLSIEEKKHAFASARAAMKEYWENPGSSEAAESAAAHENAMAHIGVALWVGGCMRGSHVTSRQTVDAAIRSSTREAMMDLRFKPVTREELERVRIEITILSPLAFPLTKEELARNEVYVEKGYLIKNGKQSGLYLPEIFNIREFGTLTELIASLGREKAGINHGDISQSEVHIFEVDDFIESTDHHSVLTLHGPVIATTKGVGIEILQKMGILAADWLLLRQDKDGNIPPILNVRGALGAQVDWVRLAFTALALAHFGAHTKNARFVAGAQKSFSYLMTHLPELEKKAGENIMLILAYTGQLASALGDTRANVLIKEKLLPYLDSPSATDPISLCQTVSFIMSESPTARAHAISKVRIAQLYQRFTRARKDGSPSLALWAELAVASLHVDKTVHADVMLWLLSHQRPDGSFPNCSNSTFVYTRGVGKIFEVLAGNEFVPREVLARTQGWLQRMQYNEENTFFIQEDMQARMWGGFRHDPMHPNAWIDAAGHVLYGITRMLPAINTYAKY